MSKEVVVLDDLISRSMSSKVNRLPDTFNKSKSGGQVSNISMTSPMVTSMTAAGSKLGVSRSASNSSQLLRLAFDQRNVIREPSPIQPRPYMNISMQNSMNMTTQSGFNYSMSNPGTVRFPTQQYNAFLQQRSSQRPQILVKKPPVQQAKKTANLNVNYTWLTLSAGDVFKEKKPKIMKIENDSDNCRPVLDFLVNLGQDLVNNRFIEKDSSTSDTLKKRRAGDDDEYIPIADESSSDSSSEEESSDHSLAKRARLNDLEENMAPEKRILKDVKFPFDHLVGSASKSCPTCSFSTISEYPLNTHFQEGHFNGFGKKPVRMCCFCKSQFPFSSPGLFMQHMQSKHGKTVSQCHQEARRYACFYCDSEANVYEKITRHITECSKKQVQASYLLPTDRDINLVFRNYLLTQYHLYGRLEADVAVPKTVTLTKPPIALSATWNLKTADTNPSTNISTTPGPAIRKNLDPGNLINMSNNSSQQFLVCELCNGMIKDLSSLFRHFALSHDVELSEPSRKRGRNMTCIDCLKRFWTREGLFYHRQYTNDRCPIGRLCIVCNQTISVYNIYEHYQMKHPESYQGNLNGTRCFMCINSVQNPISNMKEHLQAAHGLSITEESPIPKNGCEMPAKITSTFKTSLEWYRNMCKCPECNLSCINWNRLRDHLLSTGHRISCKHCACKFTTHIELQRHESITHEVDLSRTCEVCQEVCSHQNYLVHVTSHLMDCSVPIPKIS